MAKPDGEPALVSWWHKSGGLLSVVALISGLGLPAIAPEVANIVYLILSALGLLVIARRPWQVSPVTVVALCAAGLLMIAAILATGAAADLIAVSYLAPLYLVAAYALVLGRVSLAAVSLAAAFGCAGGLGIALYDAFVLGLPQPGASVNNPIHFANVVLALSFVSLAGQYDPRLRTRLVAVAGACAGLVALWLSQARGPLVALPPMLAAGIFLLVWQTLARRGRLVLVLATIVGTAALVALVWWGRILDDLGPFSDAMLLLREGVITDPSTWERVSMYQSAWNAFMASPIHGHGLSQLVDKAMPFAPEGVTLRPYDHLHSDLADFAVGGGLLGLLAYFCLLLAPLFAVNWRARSPASRAAAFIGLTICIGYFVMGLTNAMIGLLTQTVLFSVAMAVIICLSRPKGEIGTG